MRSPLASALTVLLDSLPAKVNLFKFDSHSTHSLAAS